MRKPFLDNLRCTVVLLVIFYHMFYAFNSVGVISNLGVQGIPALDVVEYVLYPRFMACLFAMAGVSARYSLQKRGGPFCGNGCAGCCCRACAASFCWAGSTAG